MTEPSLDLTIIIPSYNTTTLLRNCIASIYAHTRGIAFEVICIDDASPDGSADMVANAFPDVTLVRNKQNLLYVKNNNMGLRMARGRYACLLNSDTLLISDAFTALVKFMDEHPDAAACGPKLLNPDRTVQHCVRGFAGPLVMVLQGLGLWKIFPHSRILNRYYSTQFDYTKPQQVDSIGTTAYVIRRSTWEQAGMLDERFSLALADLVYNFMLKKKGYRVYYAPCAEVVHFGSQSINQQPLAFIRALHAALICFSEEYDYFGAARTTKAIVRTAVKCRYWLKVAEYHLSSDKRAIKGPGGPSRASST
jgi:GT2 family glycosyltransferase